MERAHRNKLAKKFRPHLKNQRIIVLGIPDEYEYMDPRLVRLFEKLVPPQHLLVHLACSSCRITGH
jgi:predicted protein tyrosine phosphatase